MSVRKLKPVTSAQRFRVVNGFDAISRKRVYSSRTKGLVVETIEEK
jgi:hypothetical protein